MVVLGVDFGTKRIGLATGDTETRIAFPLITLDVDGMSAEEAARHVVDAAKSERAEMIVVGVPGSLTGGVSETEKSALHFVEVLRAASSIAVETEDEKYTSKMADQKLRELGGRKEDRDAVAASIVLQSYLDRTKR